MRAVKFFDRMDRFQPEHMEMGWLIKAKPDYILEAGDWREERKSGVSGKPARFSCPLTPDLSTRNEANSGRRIAVSGVWRGIFGDRR